MSLTADHLTGLDSDVRGGVCTEGWSEGRSNLHTHKDISHEDFNANSGLALEQLFLTLAWYCSRITWPGNSGSGMFEKHLMITSRVCRPTSWSWSLWSVADMNAMRTRSPRCRTRKSVAGEVMASG